MLPATGLPKMSDTLVEFAAPLLDDLPVDARIDDYSAALDFAAGIWNFLTLLDREHDLSRTKVPVDSAQMFAFLDEIAFATGKTRDQAFDFLQLFTARKHRLFPDDRRIVGAVDVEDDGDRVHVVAVSSAPR